jgi:hypothetical protein
VKTEKDEFGLPIGDPTTLPPEWKADLPGAEGAADGDKLQLQTVEDDEPWIVQPQDVPGLKESGWTREMDEMCVEVEYSS